MVEYIPILILMGLAVIIASIIVGASSILGHKISQKTKMATYECGMQTIGPSRMKMNIRYYIVAMLFLIFDIEIMFLYPWAVVTGSLKMFGFLEMLFFRVHPLCWIYLRMEERGFGMGLETATPASLQEVINWARKNSIWPVTFGLACCALEMIVASSATFDMPASERKYSGLLPVRLT